MWINDTEDAYVCATVELISWGVKNNQAEDYAPEYNGRPFHEEKSDIKLWTLKLCKIQKMSNILWGKTYILLVLSTIKLNMAAKEWTDSKTFWFRNNLLWTGLGENYFLWVKTF